MLKTYKYRIYPTKEQEDLFLKHFNNVRFIYNWGLEKKIKEYEQNNKSLSYFNLAKELTVLKQNKQYSWLYEVANSSLQQSLRHLDNAFTKFFREKKGFPKFKSKKNNKQTYTLPIGVKIDFDTQRIYLPKFKKTI